MLASAAVASADDRPTAGAAQPPTAGAAQPPTAGAAPGAYPEGASSEAPRQYIPDPGGPPLDGLPVGFDTGLAPPGMTEPMIMPPGMTPPLDCADDPDWDERPECTVSGGVIRGGFGHYFWVGGG
jgi:hypothetical protein